MKANTGQTATEFVLVLPLLCGAMLGFILLILFCARAQLATYAGFMGSRVYGVWPEKIDGDVARTLALDKELKSLLQGPEELDCVSEDGVLKVHSVKSSPYLMNTLSRWEFRTETPIVIEPMTACDGEDNKIQSTEVLPCS